MTVLDAFPHLRRPRGRRQPRTFELTVEYEQDHADIERMAARLGQTEEAFLVFASRVAVWLLDTVAYREETGETAEEGAA